MSDAELARFFVTGQAAKIVTASDAADKTTDAEYKKVQQLRVDEAKKILASVKSVPQAAALIAAPNEDNARKLVAAIADKDLSSEVGSMLPSKKKYE